MANKVKFGIDQVHYSIVTEGEDGTLSFGKWAELKNAVSLTGDVDSNQTNEYADNKNIFSITNVSSETITLEVEDLPDDFLTTVLGWKTDATTGAMAQPTDAIKRHIALGFRMKGDEKHRIVWFFDCDVSDDSNDSAETNTDSVTIQHDSITLVAHPVEIGNSSYLKARLMEGDAGYSAFWTKAPVLPTLA